MRHIAFLCHSILRTRFYLCASAYVLMAWPDRSIHYLIRTIRLPGVVGAALATVCASLMGYDMITGMAVTLYAMPTLLILLQGLVMSIALAGLHSILFEATLLCYGMRMTERLRGVCVRDVAET